MSGQERIGFTEKYEFAISQLVAGELQSARQLLYDIYIEYQEPLVLLRVGHIDFISGKLESIQFPEILKPEDAWIKLGIYRAAILGLQEELSGWLSISEKVSNSKRIRAFLLACENLCLVETDLESVSSRSQEVLRMEKLIVSKEYWRLLEGSIYFECFIPRS